MRARPATVLAALLAVVTATGVAVAPAAAAGQASSPKPRSPASPHGWSPRPHTALPWPSPLLSPAPSGAAVPHLDPRLRRSATGSGSPVHVAVRSTDVPAVAQAVRRAGGRILGVTRSDVSAVVPPATLVGLAATPGVAQVAPAVRARPDGTPSEGVHATNADVWQQTSGFSGRGAGVTVAVVDAGFANLNAVLPGQTVTGNYCANVNGTDHGSAVAEIVHEMAPAATLQLYCVDDTIGFQQAETALQATGAKVVNSSLTFPGDSRGDGTGSDISAATTVETARKAGILWVTSAGNTGADHWGGNLTDLNRNGYADLKNGSETDYLGVDGGEAEVWLRWDQWPTSTLGVRIVYSELDSSGAVLVRGSSPLNSTPSRPVTCVAFNSSVADGCTDVSLNPAATDVAIGISVPSAALGLHYDLSYYGSVSNNTLSCVHFTGNTCDGPDPLAAAGSIEEPASSPYALAVGAADVVSTQLEFYSSRGPTVDGRSKPDIVGPDGVSSTIYGARGSTDGGFYGTSASAPHVAGAAALVMGAAGPPLDAAQVEAFLEGRTSQHHDAPNSQLGYGLLGLGAPSGVAAPVGSGYVPLAQPIRTYDTRTAAAPGGKPPAPMGAGEVRTVTVPNRPAGATAVAINLGGTQATGPTNLTVAPVASAATSNLNLNTIDATAAVYAVVPIGPGGTIAVRNSSATTHMFLDTLGYYVANTGLGFTSRTPVRILDTRTQHQPVVAYTARDVSVDVAALGLPTDVSALVINVTAVNETGSGYLTVSPTSSSSSSTLDYYKARTRANLTVVSLTANKHFTVFSGGGASTDAVIDLFGYFTPSSTGKFVALSPIRIADTRYGNGGQHSQLGAGGTVTYTGSGIYQVPYGATALMTGIVPVPAANSVDSYLTVYPVAPRPPSSNINFGPGRVVPNAVLANLGPPTAPNRSRTFSIFNSQGRTDVVVDLFGYFLG